MLFWKKKWKNLQKKEISDNPGAAFRYNNIGLNIAARIAEVVTKKRFDMLIKQKLFNPLGMRQITFSTLSAAPVNPSGGAKSTAADYTKFLQMLLNDGTYNGSVILSKSSVAEMRKIANTTDQVKYAPKSAVGFTYASGAWVLESVTGQATVLSSPGLFGTWPMVDYCRGYTALFFVKNYLGEQKADVYLAIKKIIDTQFANRCK